MFSEGIFTLHNEGAFVEKCLEIFRYQAANNKVYRDFISYLGKDPRAVSALEEIPFLPIEFFKSFQVITGDDTYQGVFLSSGTTSSTQSRHYVKDLKLYEQSFTRAFRHFYGEPDNYHILALLPNYLERQGSSLVYMADRLIAESRSDYSGFYLHDLRGLAGKLRRLDRGDKKVLLLGVSYALLDLVEMGNFKLKNTIVMETGGMKGRRREMVKQELHQVLIEGFGTERVHSEYGMTELLSQAYSKGEGLFTSPPWMRVMIRDTEDPLAYLPEGKTGGINVIDLANMHSCSFIATQDLGRGRGHDQFEVVGRFDHSDIRGCNLMVV